MKDNWTCSIGAIKVTLVATPPDAVELCRNAASICTGGNPEKALKVSMESGHESVLEHANFTFRVEGISRVTLAQLTRHRIASYTVQSQRYTHTETKYVLPETIAKSNDGEFVEQFLQFASGLYEKLLNNGIPKEDARYILPQAVTTSLYMTMNVRELRHFFGLRTCNRAQWEIRKLADAMLVLCKRFAPDLFENSGPACIRGECMEARPCGNPRRESDWDVVGGELENVRN